MFSNTAWMYGRLAPILLAISLAPSTPVMDARSGPAMRAERPNVLIILTDDQRLSGTMAVLPHVRRWFGEGGRTFTHAFATTPLCCPSRASILSGRYAHNHGILTNAGTGRNVFDQQTTVERYLQDAGYRTAIFGKFFNFWRIEDDPSFFDRWAIVNPSRRSNGYRGGLWNVQGTLRTIAPYSTNYIATMATRFIDDIEQNDAEPWFLELATYAPHLRAVPASIYEDAPVGPFRPTPAMEESNRSDKPPFVRAEQAKRGAMVTARERQLRTLMSVDDLVARLAETLQQTDESRDTLAFFLSDNGFLWGEHGTQAKGPAYGPGVRIPFLTRWPGHIEEGSIDGRLIATIDIAPTILDAAGIEADPDVPMDGRLLLSDQWTRDRILLESWPWVGTSAPAWASLWGPRSQYTEYYTVDGVVSFREYYDLRRDPWQLTNLLHDGDPGNDPEIGTLHERLRSDRACVGAECP